MAGNPIPLFTMFSQSDNQTSHFEGLPNPNPSCIEIAPTRPNIQDALNKKEKEQTAGGWARENLAQNATIAEG